jgi:hypothetical protein
MTIEQSHGKARPTLPRSSDLPKIETVRDPSEGRAEAGRFAPGNQHARGHGWKTALKKMLGREVATEEAAAVANDAWKIFCANVREMPSDGSMVRGLLMRKARHEALSAFWEHRAAEVGLATDEGVKAQAEALKHGQRAERLAVTAIDIATRLASKKEAEPFDPLAAYRDPPKASER